MNYKCAKCGADVGNGGVASCAIVSDIDPDQPGMVRNLRFCRDREDNGETIKGCASRVLSAANLKHYMEERDGAQ